MTPLTLTITSPRQLAEALQNAAAWINAIDDDEHDNLTRAEDAMHDARFYLDNYTSDHEEDD